MKRKRLVSVVAIVLILAILLPGTFGLAADNSLFDGGFEQYPDSTYWVLSDPLGSVYNNGHMNTHNVWDNLWMPRPLCGAGIYNVGHSPLPFDWHTGSAPAYYFLWPGGTLYWQVGMHGPADFSFSPLPDSYAEIYLRDNQGNITTLLSNHAVPWGGADAWTREYGSVSLTEGGYQIYLGRGSSMPMEGGLVSHALYYDDVFVGPAEPDHNNCQENIEQATPTPNLTPWGPTESPTPYPTVTATLGPTPTPYSHYYYRSVTIADGSAHTWNWNACEPGDRIAGGSALYHDSWGNSWMGMGIYSNSVTWSVAQPSVGEVGAWWYDTSDDHYQMITFGLVHGNDFGTHSSTTSGALCGPYSGCDVDTSYQNFNTNGGGSTSVDMYMMCYGNESNIPTPTLTPTGATPTASLTPTPTTKLYNCGFEYGQAGWIFISPSYVDLAGGPTGPQHAVAVKNSAGSLPNIYQDFYWINSEWIYIQAWVKGQTQIRIWNIYSNLQQALIYSANDADWKHIQYSAYIPSGYYRLELNTWTVANQQNEGRFDGVTLAPNYYLDDGICAMATPTPGATSYVSPTAGPSLTPSITMTPRTSITPWGTYTPAGGSVTATPYGTPLYSPTPANDLTRTAYASITPGSGGGGGGGGGDMPPDQPPGGEEAPCVRPQNWWSIAFWIDYEVCDIKRFVSWGPSNSATAVAIPTMFASKEPFASIGQIRDGFSQLTTQVASRSWNNTGFPGVSSTQVNPLPGYIFNPLAPGNPWAIGGSINLNNSTGIVSFSKYCSTQLSSMLASRLAEGLCFVLNITKSIGYLGWIQFVFNVALIFATIRLVLSTMNYYGNFIQSQIGTVEPPAQQATAKAAGNKR